MNKNRKLGVTSETENTENVKKAVTPDSAAAPTPPRVMPSSSARKIVSAPVDVELPPEEEEELSFFRKNSKMVLGGGSALLVIILIIVIIVSNSKSPPIVEIEQPIASTEPVLSEAERIQRELEAANIGKDFYENRNLQTKVESDSVFSLEGKDVPEMWSMKNDKSYAFISTLIPYTKHRAVTGEGIEIYWLEGIYNGQPCKFTIPYVYYKSLAASGSCAVRVEVIETQSGEKIATSFSFDYDAQINLGKTKK